MAHGNPVPKLYKSVIEDVIESIQGLFAEEGVDKQVLRNLKELWETKVMQSKATEGLFKHSHHSSHLTVQFPHNFHHVLQASTASFVIPTGGGFQHFMAADLGASQKGATLTFPSSVAYPIHVPAGLTLQTASGQLYKVNMPVMVAHGQGDASILQHPLQQVFQPIGQPSVLKTNLATVAPMEPTEQVESDLQSEKGICSDTEGIIQLDGTCDGSPKKEVLHTKDTEENEFIDIIESEDLKILEDEEDEEADSISNSESSSSCDNEEPQTDVVEEDPLNSDDDVSDLDIADLFDTNNVIVCQYEKIHRSKNKWKFFLKDGVMSFNGKDYVFAKAVGDAEW
ncbi:TFIIA-alpha and beta-like factor isoform X3 [Gallus gallus]|uniref:TFIIA-alpha and beta-like factor isoform X3 n=1 Tax=Gallus gallus TaxID=9031 RepID=UPI000739BC2B|nr:TFIIA-alpha and beta-like factor isoform X3 [Gallus gallus]XP_046768788.1 TFIIA-alpha and beta-like factor isoform X3 [Gallus gallus]|eukprot:XP_015133501.1 TFIIA-alpha and beta-like factor isoform X2 [Gallus gallus]